jgi:hypothetical protein
MRASGGARHGSAAGIAANGRTALCDALALRLAAASVQRICRYHLRPHWLPLLHVPLVFDLDGGRHHYHQQPVCGSYRLAFASHIRRILRRG